jgi:TolA-binding protein
MDETTAWLNLVSARLAVVDAKLDLALLRLGASEERDLAMSAEVDRIRASVTQLTSVTQGAVTLLGQLAQRVRDLSGDPAALTALADEIDQRKQELATAVTTNTPAQGGGGTPAPGGGTPPAAAGGDFDELD